jgi:hypothetical protein
MDRIYSALIPEASNSTRDAIATTLAKFGNNILKFAAKAGVTVRPLLKGELYRDASPALTRLILFTSLFTAVFARFARMWCVTTFEATRRSEST